MLTTEERTAVTNIGTIDISREQISKDER